jgi:hypothetical protein
VAFIPQVKNAIIILLRATSGMIVFKPGQAFREEVAYFNHETPRRGNFRQIVFVTSANSHQPVNEQQLVFQSHCFDLEGRAKSGRNFGNPRIKLRHRRFSKLL